jgi:streptomycin 3"-adenylyltransferase
MQQVIAFNEEAPGKGLELSIVTRDAVNPFRYPTPFVLHFSPMHLDWFRRDPTGYVQHMKGEDPDLAAHCTIVRKRGVVLYGAPVEEIFGEVPKAAYLDSIRQDVAGAGEDILTDPLYMTLNLCRVLAYAREGLVLSKQEGGQWGLSHLPGEHCPVIRLALDCYANDRSMQIDAAAARAFAAAMLESIASAAAHAG